MGENVCVMSICVFVVLIGLVDVLLCFIDPRVGKIRNEASSALGSSPELFAFTMLLAPPVRCVFALVVILRQWVLSESRGPLNRLSYGFGERTDLRCRISVVCVK